jgi:hypothetical protein
LQSLTYYDIIISVKRKGKRKEKKNMTNAQIIFNEAVELMKNGKSSAIV